jgi:hypothetical protein
MPDEPSIAITHPGIPGDEVKVVPLVAFFDTWQPLGWIEAAPGMQPTEVYLIPSSEKNAPYGVATLDENGIVVQPGGGGGGGGLTVGEVNELIDEKIADITAASIGAMPADADIVLFNSGVLEFTQRATHPTVVAGKAQFYQLTDGSFWLQLPSGARTQLGPAFEHLDVELSAEKIVNSLTLSTVISAEKTQPNAVYRFEVFGAFEATVAASGERLRVTFDPPPGATGFYMVQSLAVTQAAANGSASYIAKLLTETFDIHGSGAGEERYFRIEGWLYTDDHDPYPSTEAAFDFRARLSTLEGAGPSALVPAKIYGANTVGYDAARMILERVK